MGTFIYQKYIWLICGLVSLSIAISACHSPSLSESPQDETVQKVTDRFFELVAKNRLSDAFNLLSNTFQTSIQNSPQGLKGRLPPALLEVYKQGEKGESASLDWSLAHSFQRDGQRQLLIGRFEQENQWKAVIITHIQNEDQVWKIHAITVVNLSDNDEYELADMKTSLKATVLNSTKVFLSSLKESNIDTFYNHLSEEWRSQVNIDNLQYKFKDLLGKYNEFRSLDSQSFSLRYIRRYDDMWAVHADINSFPSKVDIYAAYVHEGFDLKLNEFDIRVECYLEPFCRPSLSTSKIILVLIDNSRSITQEEKEAFREAIRHFISQIRGDIRIRIRLYGQEDDETEPKQSPLVILPHKGSMETLTQFINQDLNFTEPETHTVAAVRTAIKQLEDDVKDADTDSAELGNAPHLEKMIILINDGDRHDRREEELAAVISQTARHRIRIHTVGVRSGPHQKMLQQLSKETRGYYFHTFYITERAYVNNMQDELNLLAEIISRSEPLALAFNTWVHERYPDWFYLQGGGTSTYAAPRLDATIGPEPSPNPLEVPSQVMVVFGILAGCGLLGFVWWRYRRSTSREIEPTPRAPDVDMCLQGIGGEALQMHYPIARGETRIGRSEPNHLILDKLRSTNQAIIRYTDGLYWLEDAGSLSGTYLNGERVLTAQPLSDQDEIRFNTHNTPSSAAYIFRFCKAESRHHSS